VENREKSEKQNIVTQRFADSIMDNRYRDFWSEVRKINGITHGLANVIEEISDVQGIADMFASNIRIYITVNLKKARKWMTLRENILTVSLLRDSSTLFRALPKMFVTQRMK
jgi:predicted DNA-binding ribbon-helix-helix protein